VVPPWIGETSLLIDGGWSLGGGRSCHIHSPKNAYSINQNWRRRKHSILNDVVLAKPYKLGFLNLGSGKLQTRSLLFQFHYLCPNWFLNFLIYAIVPLEIFNYLFWFEHLFQIISWFLICSNLKFFQISPCFDQF
jgi:hypothetical protein